MRRFPAVFAAFIFIFLPIGRVYAAIPVQNSSFTGEAALDARYGLISAAEKYLGTPYRYGGIDSRGIDCSGLVYVSFRDSLRIAVPRTTTSLYNWAEKIPTSDLRPGDLVFFVTGGGSAVSHAGIFMGNGNFIHSASEGPRTGVMYSNLNEDYWKRTYTGAGRALPWDTAAETAFAASGTVPAVPGAPGRTAVYSGWSSSSGLFAGGGLAFTAGKSSPDMPSVFRGLAAQVKVGYKGFPNDSFQAALELRPQWDNALGIIRLPLTFSFGNDQYQVFAGPALTLGDPALRSGGEYYPSFYWLGELGFSAAVKPISAGRGALSFFGEAAWQPYTAKDNQPNNFGSDFAANSRISFGVRYLFLLSNK